MILIDVAKTGDISISVSGDKFYDNIDFLKRNHFKYVPEYKYWTDEVNKIYSFIDQFKELDSCRVSVDAQDILETEYSKKETVFYDTPIEVDPSLFIYQPMKGKPPFEDFQMEDIKRGLSQNRFYYANHMGTGKTFIILMVLAHLYKKGLLDRILILTPGNALVNWKREVLKFTNFFKEEDFYIADRWNRKPFVDTTKIAIMTYRTFLMLSDDAYKEKYPKQKKKVKRYTRPPIDFDDWSGNRMLIGDEFHYCANKTARQTHAVTLHKDYFEYRYAASGTPNPNGVEQYYSQLNILDEGIIPEDYYSWIKKIAYVGNYFSEYAITGYKAEEIQKFSSHISPWIVQRRAEDCLDLPPHIIERMYVRLSPKQKAIYEGVVESVLLKIKEDRDTGTSKAFKIRNKLPFILLAVDNPAILLNNLNDNSYIFNDKLVKAIKSFKLTDLSKLEAIDDIIENSIDMNGKKLIVWSGHPLTLDQLKEHYSKYDPLVIHGQINGTNQERDVILEKFKNSKQHNLLLGSYKVISQAVNLTEASVNVYIDRSFDLKDWLQSLKRTDRIGQTKTVYTYPVIAEGTLDESLDKMLENKELQDKVFLKASSYSLKDLKEIFTGSM